MNEQATSELQDHLALGVRGRQAAFADTIAVASWRPACFAAPRLGIACSTDFAALLTKTTNTTYPEEIEVSAAGGHLLEILTKTGGSTNSPLPVALTFVTPE